MRFKALLCCIREAPTLELRNQVMYSSDSERQCHRSADGSLLAEMLSSQQLCFSERTRSTDVDFNQILSEQPVGPESSCWRFLGAKIGGSFFA